VTGRAEKFGVATFHSTYSVLKAEKLLKGAGLEEVRLIPVPNRISSDCGVTVRFRGADLDRAREILETLRYDLEGIYLQEGDLWETIFEEKD
jgi:hypothetical protein